MKTSLAVAVLAVATFAACSGEAPPPPPPPPAPVAAPAAAPTPAPVAAVEPAKPAEPAPAAAPAPEPKAAPKAAPVGQKGSPAPAATHAKVGDEKCRMCHRLQHDSWSETPHKAKGLDCEGCHGGGADFVKVMRDRTAAVAAGLMLPTKGFCLRCHRADWQDGMLQRVHAHKVR